MSTSAATRIEAEIKRPKPWHRRWLRRLGWALGILTVCVLGFVLWVWATCFARPPAIEGHPAILDQELRKIDGRQQLGANWFDYQKGHSRLYIEGDPFSMGYANATLTQDLLHAQEKSLIDTVETFFPSRISLAVISLVVLVNNRNLPDYVPLRYQQEIFGLSEGGGIDPYPEFGPRYHRILNYHAAHDISHWVWDEPALGCSAFAVLPQATEQGKLIVGRNFDWESGSHFDENKVIGLYRPELGYAFLSVSWPGMAGAVTGINEKKIFCAINGAHSESMGTIGMPVSLVVREVLQFADSLESAAAIIEKAPVFVADAFLIADGETGTALVVEKSPAKHARRQPEDGVLLLTNHFESPAFAEDRGNRDYIRDGTTASRHARLKELVTESVGKLSITLAVSILRDHLGPKGAERALGHRGTINPMIATHAVVADVSSGLLYVSRGPHQLGSFDAYSIDNFDPRAPQASDSPASIPAVSAAELAAYRQLKQQRTVLEGKTDEAALRRALLLVPGDPTVLQRLGKLLEREGKLAAARAEYQAALAAIPPFAPQRAAIEQAIARLPHD